jgi:hypothetical protein
VETWEYKQVELDDDEIEDELNTLGAEGWEAVGITHDRFYPGPDESGNVQPSEILFQVLLKRRVQ